MSKPIKPKQKLVFNPLEGQFDLVAGNNFSYESVPQNKKLLIPDNNQMIFHGEFFLEGELQIDGSFVVEE